MKLNNKGFAITSILYGLLILFVLLVSSYLMVLSARKNKLDSVIKDAEDDYFKELNSKCNTATIDVTNNAYVTDCEGFYTLHLYYESLNSYENEISCYLGELDSGVRIGLKEGGRRPGTVGIYQIAINDNVFDAFDDCMQEQDFGVFAKILQISMTDDYSQLP